MLINPGCGARRNAAKVKSLVCATLLVLGGLRAGGARADARAALPAAVGAFRMNHPAVIFTPATLENHIDGGAESVKHYQFRQCDYAEYAPGGKGTQLITVDIYEMGSPLDSYGYYSYQLSPSAKTVQFVPIGAQGYQTQDSLTFWKGDYYVNVTVTAAGAPAAFRAALPQFGRAIAAKLSGSSEMPAMLKLLPAGYTPHSEKYERTNVAGQAFLENGVSALYPSAGPQAAIFVAAYASPTAAKQAYDQYVASLNRPIMVAVGAKVTPVSGIGASAVSVKTRFHGQAVAALQGKYVIGVRGARDAGLAQQLARAAVARAR